MSWRRTLTLPDRLLACAPYIVPLLEVAMAGVFLFLLIPPLKLIYSPILILLPIYKFDIGNVDIVAWAVFIGLYVGVVKNNSFSHFMRYNTMQALLLAIFSYLCFAILELFGISESLFRSRVGENTTLPILSLGSFVPLLLSAIFLVVVIATIFSVIQALRGVYGEIPVLSKAVYQLVDDGPGCCR